MKSVIIPICLFLYFVSCNMMNGEDHAKMSEEEAQKAIVGTWERIAWGMYIDDVSDDDGSVHEEYLANGIYNGYMAQSFSAEKGYTEYQFSPPSYIYRIENDILILKSSICDECSDVRYKYRFFENGEKLELIDADWKPCTEPGEDEIVSLILLARIKIYKKIY